MSTPSRPVWRRPSSCSRSGNCAEVAFHGGLVLVRDSRRPSVVLRFTPDEWAAFTAGVEVGDFDIEAQS